MFRKEKNEMTRSYKIQAVGTSRTCFAQSDPRLRRVRDVSVANFTPSRLKPMISSTASIVRLDHGIIIIIGIADRLETEDIHGT